MPADGKRLFLAVNLSLATTRKIAEAVTRLTKVQTPLRVAWVPPANLHVTLKFLGWTRAEAIDAVRDEVREATRGKKAFEVVARGAGAFPGVKRPRVLWIGAADPSGALGKLAADLEARMVALGFARDDHPFRAHVTLGRVKSGSDEAGAESLLAPILETDFGTSLVREVVLYESVTKSTGSEYSAQFRVPLEAPPYRAERQTREVETDPAHSEEPDPHGGEQSA